MYAGLSCGLVVCIGCLLRPFLLRAIRYVIQQSHRSKVRQQTLGVGRVLVGVDDLPEDDETCPICLDSLWDKNTVSTSGLLLLPCGHTFHFNCVTEWFERNLVCPSCRHATENVANCYHATLRTGPRALCYGCLHGNCKLHKTDNGEDPWAEEVEEMSQGYQPIVLPPSPSGSSPSGSPSGSQLIGKPAQDQSREEERKDADAHRLRFASSLFEGITVPPLVLAAAQSAYSSSWSSNAAHATQPGTSSAAAPLPQGWGSAKDPGTGRTYYFKRGTAKSQWERPTEQESLEMSVLQDAGAPATASNDMDDEHAQLILGDSAGSLDNSLRPERPSRAKKYQRVGQLEEDLLS